MQLQRFLERMEKQDLIIDCFAGGGGASVGIEMALGRPVDIAINHDPQAILMHKTNHPNTLHLTEDIFKVDLQKYVKGRQTTIYEKKHQCFNAGKTEFDDHKEFVFITKVGANDGK